MQRRVARTYQEYVQEKKRKGEKPLGKPEWEARQNGRSEDSKGQGKKSPGDGGGPPKGKKSPGDGGGTPKGKKPESLPPKSKKALLKKMTSSVGEIASSALVGLRKQIKNMDQAAKRQVRRDQQTDTRIERHKLRTDTEAAFRAFRAHANPVEGWGSLKPKEKRLVAEAVIQAVSRVGVWATVFASLPLGGVAGAAFSAYVGYKAQKKFGDVMERMRARSYQTGRHASEGDALEQLGPVIEEALKEALKEALDEIPDSEGDGEKEDGKKEEKDEKKAARRVASIWTLLNYSR